MISILHSFCMCNKISIYFCQTRTDRNFFALSTILQMYTYKLHTGYSIKILITYLTNYWKNGYIKFWKLLKHQYRNKEI